MDRTTEVSPMIGSKVLYEYFLCPYVVTSLVFSHLSSGIFKLSHIVKAPHPKCTKFERQQIRRTRRCSHISIQSPFLKPRTSFFRELTRSKVTRASCSPSPAATLDLHCTDRRSWSTHARNSRQLPISSPACGGILKSEFPSKCSRRKVRKRAFDDK